MQDFLNQIGIDAQVFRLVILPILIFIARIMDVSINTVRIIFMLNSKRLISTLLGFFESLIWLLAIGQIFQNIDSAMTYLAYAGGFASGILVGMWIEEKLAVGTVLIRIITQQPADELVDYLIENKYRHTVVDGHSDKTRVNVLFTVVKRSKLDEAVQAIKKFNPLAFYTIEGIKKVSDDDLLIGTSRLGWSKRIRKH